MELEFQKRSEQLDMMLKRKAMEAACLEDNSKGKDGSTTTEWDPWDPPCPPCPNDPPYKELHLHIKDVLEWMHLTRVWIAKFRATSIIIPDRTPQWVNSDFWDITPSLRPILRNDNVQLFLRFFKENTKYMVWGLIITPLTFEYIVFKNALRCAKVLLEGKEPELCGFRANPNCMNQFGFFPLHEAAENFSVDMIKLLLRYGASANLRTVGPKVIEDLLPLHIAVDNACLHKYLEDNLFPNQEHPDYSKADSNYIYKLIHLLCLPEMKIFLDATRLLAKHTNNLVDELWNYMKDGKLVPSAVLLLAAQEQIRGKSSSKRNGNGKRDGFDIIITRIVKHSAALRWEMDKTRKARKQLKVKSTLIDYTMLLAVIISQAGEALDAYIQTHSEVPHVEVLERVSSILGDYGFCPTGEGIDIGNLCPYPYECEMSGKELPNKHGDVDATEAARNYLHAATEKALTQKIRKAWDLEYKRKSFIPYWRSVLDSKCIARVVPSFIAKSRPVLSVEELRKTRNKSERGYSSVLNHEKHGLGTIPQLSNRQSRRLFGTAALTLLKVLKNA